MKLLHQQLLTGCAPYLALIAGVFLLQSALIEPMVLREFQQTARRELNLHAESIRLVLERAKAQLRQMADLPAMRTGETQTIVAELGRLRPQQHGPFEGIAFRDLTDTFHTADGKTFPVVNNALINLRPADQEFVTDPGLIQNGTKAAVQIYVPVVTDADVAVGSLAGDIAMTNLWSALQPELPIDTGLLTLQSSVGGQTFSTLNSHLPGMPNSALAFPASANPRNAEYRKWIGQSIGVPQMPYWTLAYSIPESQLYRPTRIACRTIAALAALSAAIAAGAIVWQNRFVSTRFAALTETIQQFGASDPAIRSRDHASDELGGIAEAFNCMADDVQHVRRKLEKQLAEHERSPSQSAERIAELEQFAGSVAHELKGPLVTLQGFAAGLESAAKLGEGERTRHDLARMQRLCQDLRTMVDQFLSDAKGEGERTSREPVALSDAAARAVELLRGPIDQCQIEVVISRELPTVTGDPLGWRQAFQNLIENSVKACAGTNHPKIEIGSKVENGKTMCFVRDNGAGLPAGEASRLFELPESAGLRSAGRGLAVVKRIVERAGGTLRAEGEPGRGMTVSWTLGD